jgi:hypothetical protein
MIDDREEAIDEIFDAAYSKVYFGKENEILNDRSRSSKNGHMMSWVTKKKNGKKKKTKKRTKAPQNSSMTSPMGQFQESTFDASYDEYDKRLNQSSRSVTFVDDNSYIPLHEDTSFSNMTADKSLNLSFRRQPGNPSIDTPSRVSKWQSLSPGTKKRVINEDGPNGWMVLRNMYIKQLKKFVFVEDIDEELAPTDNPSDKMVNNNDNEMIHKNDNDKEPSQKNRVNFSGTVRQFSENDRKVFFALLIAYRKISVKILRLYKERAALALTMTECELLKNYVELMVEDMDWLHVEPVLKIIRLQVRVNPLFCIKRMDGISALYCPGNISLNSLDVHEQANLLLQIPGELAISKLEFEELVELGQVIWELCGKQRDMVQEIDMHMNRELKVALKGLGNAFGVATGADSYGEVDELSASVCFQGWKEYYLKRKGVVLMRRNKTLYIQRVVFDQFVFTTWQCKGYRNLQLMRQANTKNRVLICWRIYVLWCRKFNSLFRRSLLARLRYNFHKLHMNEQTTTLDRDFKKKRKANVLRLHFNHLRYNVVLNYHHLQMRLGKGNPFSFFDTSVRRKCFDAWVKYLAWSKTADILESKSEKIMFCDMFKRWRLVTWPQRPKVNIRERLRAVIAVSSSVVAKNKEASKIYVKSFVDRLRKQTDVLSDVEERVLKRQAEKMRTSRVAYVKSLMNTKAAYERGETAKPTS